VTYLEPALPLLLLLGCVDVVRAWYRTDRRRRPWLETIVIGGIAFLSMNAGAWLLSRPLEMWYGRDAMPQENADAIVVLAGTVSPPTRARPYALPAEDTYRRVQHAVWLFRYWRPVPILVSGGGNEKSPHAETMRRVLESERIPGAMIWTESRSSNTHENAVYAADILRAHNVSRVVLVVEASGMLRAAQSFRKAGVTVVPSPVRYTQLTWEFDDFMPGWRGIQSNGEAIHELVGLVWYKLRGWI
jgi:uncharacterized SAM-binding protein YcdF (DUF218 family)